MTRSSPPVSVAKTAACPGPEPKMLSEVARRVAAISATEPAEASAGPAAGSARSHASERISASMAPNY